MHVRSQLRRRFKDVFERELPANGYTVFASRKSAINHDPGRAFVDMRFQNDQTRQPEVMDQSGREPRLHVVSLYIRVQRSENEEVIDDLLDDDEVRIVEAIHSEYWLDMLEDEPELVQVNFSDNASSGQTLGSIILRYDLEYRINKDDPTIVIQ